jgi:hypothetical protein
MVGCAVEVGAQLARKPFYRLHAKTSAFQCRITMHSGRESPNGSASHILRRLLLLSSLNILYISRKVHSNSLVLCYYSIDAFCLACRHLVMAVLMIVLTLAIALISWPILNILKHYIEARSIGLPIIINPINLLNPIWMVTQKPLKRFFKSLPFGLGDWIVYSGFGSVFSNRYRLHAKHGPAYLVVTPKEIALFVDDAELAEEILGKRKDIIKSEEAGKAVNLFGTNVVSNNGEDWARHRRITTPPFNERNSNTIWRESLAQASGSKFYSLSTSSLLSSPMIHGADFIKCFNLGHLRVKMVSQKLPVIP